MLVVAVLTALAAVAWLYLLTGHGAFWLTGQRLPQVSTEPSRWPAVTAVVPARDEAAMLPVTLPALLGQDYPGELEVIVVDDGSADGTAAIAEQLGRAAASPDSSPVPPDSSPVPPDSSPVPPDSSPVPPDSSPVPPDSSPVPPDSSPVPPDSSPVPPDSSPVPPDSSPVPPDSSPVPPDSSPVPPDSSPVPPDSSPVPPDSSPVPPDLTPGPLDLTSLPPAPPHPRTLRVIAGSPPPAGWAGKVWAMSQGAAEAGAADYLLFTDADIACRPGVLTALVTAAEGDGRDLVSQMALLRAESFAERAIVPAFVYFFAQLYPFRRVNRPGGRTAAAAGGCMLVRGRALAASGGLAALRGARIDDVTLGRQIKRRGPAGRCWLGLTTEVASVRPYPGLASLWHMIARSAYTQLRYSPVLLGATIAGLLWLYLLPPAAAIAGLTGLAVGGGAGPAWCVAAGLAGWALMSVSYVPMLRLYRLSIGRAPTLPLIAALYAAMTFDSARRHHAGRGGEWKGRLSPQPPPRSGPPR